ncbi:MAG: FAD-binding oxidoreductase [Rhodococcus sp. (in: high G+C Gram-positive bacteria)]|nr:MAG: FAD-binding oxidoreductase [Rhodococcus sp. (in: high G+C Gram-positive bacteria)]
MDSLRAALADVVGERFVTVDADVLAARATDHTGRYSGRASALVRPADAAEVSAVLGICRRAGVKVTVQGGRTGLEAGTVPEHDDVLLSTERLTAVGAVDRENLRVTVGAGVTLSTLRNAAADAGLLFGVDIASRDSATIGGMVSTNAGGLHTVRYGHMSAQVLGLEVVLPDGAIVRRSMRVGAGRRDLTDELAGALEQCDPDDEPAVGIDPAGRARVWAAREAFAEVVGLFGPPLKFDAALPLDTLAAFVADAVALVTGRAPDAVPVLFGHVADGNVHLNVLRCPDESVLYRPVTELIRDHGGNIASEHGVGAHKRNYLDLALGHEDITAMWAIKQAFDPADYLNPAVMFPDWLRRPH